MGGGIASRSSATRRKLSGALASLALIAGLAVAAPPAAAALEPSVRVIGSTVTVRPTDRPAGAAGASLVAARNEFESFQVVVAAGDQSLRELRVELAEPLTGESGTIPTGNVTIYRAETYDVTGVPSDSGGALGRWPDALIPAVDPLHGEQRNAFTHAGFTLDVPAQENRLAWVDVLVPEGQRPGVYRGSLRVSARGLDVAVPLRLSVVDLTLPSRPSFGSAIGLTHRKICQGHYAGGPCPTPDEEWRLISDYARIGLDNRLMLDNITPGTPDNAVTIDRFRRHMLPLYTGTSESRLPGARLDRMLLYPWCDADCIRAWRLEADRSGFRDSVVYYACDEPNNSTRSWEEVCGPNITAARAAWGTPRLPVAVTATIQHATDAGLAEEIDILLPLVNFLHDKPDSIRAGGRFAGNQRGAYDAWLSRREGREVWTYQACFSHGCERSPPTDGRCAPLASDDPYWLGWPSLVIDTPASQQRAAGWIGYAYDTTGELYYDSIYAFWQVGAETGPSRTDAWAEQYCFGGHGDGTLFYPGTPARIGGRTDIPIESIRMKRMRDGREDHEYLREAERRGRGAEARQRARTLMPTTYSTTVSHAQIDAARLDVLALMGITVPTDGPALVRLSGPDRFATAAVVAREAFASAGTVVLARGDDFPDALAGSYLAGQLDAPILLSAVDHVPAVTLEAIRALAASRVVLLGGRAALGERVADQLRAAGLQVDRIAGSDRFDTASRIAQHAGAGAVGDLPGSGRTAILANGAAFPDALAAGPLSFSSALPTLLTGSAALHPSAREAIAALGIRQVLIVGGSAVVTPAVEAELAAAGVRVRRLSGPDRWATAATIADYAIDELGFGAGYVHVARGDAFPDALSGGPHAGRGQRRGPILLSASDRVVGPTCDYLERRGGALVGGSVYGGTAAVHEGTRVGLEQCATVETLAEPPADDTAEPPPADEGGDPEPEPVPPAPPRSTAIALSSADGVLGAGDELTVTFDAMVEVHEGDHLVVIDHEGDEAQLTCGANARCEVTGSGLDRLVVRIDDAPQPITPRGDGRIDVDQAATVVRASMGNRAAPWNVPASGVPSLRRVFGLSVPGNGVLHPAVAAADVTVDVGARTVSVRDEGCANLPEYASFYVHAADGPLLSGVDGNPEVGRDGGACVVSAPLREGIASGDTLLLLYRIAGPFTFSVTLAHPIP